MKDQLIEVIENPTRSFNDRVNEFEKLLMLEALERANWVKLRAARSLQVTYRIFNYKYEKFGLHQHHPRRHKQRTAQLVC